MTVCEPALAPSPGAISLLFPVADDALDTADPAALAAMPWPLPLVYVGNQYDRDSAFIGFFVPAAARHRHRVAGKWTRTAQWPHRGGADARYLLPPYESGFIEQRVMDAAYSWQVTANMGAIGEDRGASAADIATGWAIAKGTTPIIGVTKAGYMDGLIRARGIELADEEIAELEALADAADVDTRGSWEHEM